MTEETSIETLQAEVIALKDEHEKMMAELQASTEASKAMAEDLKRARDLNAKLLAREGAQQDPEKQDPYAGMTDEEALEKMLPELVDREASKMYNTKEA